VDVGSLVFLPILGGYLFFTHFNGTRYRASSFPAQRLIFPAAAYGLVFLAIARAIELLCLQVTAHPEPWNRLAFRGILPGTAWLAGLTAIIAVKLFFGNTRDIDPTLVDVEQLKSARRQVVVRASGLLASAIVVFEVCARSQHIAELNLFATCFFHGLLVGIVVIGLALFIANRTDWPILGLLLRLATAFLLIAVLFALAVKTATDADSIWRFFTDEDHVQALKGSGIPTLSLVVACLACFVCNIALPQLAAAAHQNGSDRSNSLKQLFYRSLVEKKLLEVSLSSGKSYIGWIVSQPPTLESADGYFVILPAMSGYRNKDTKKLEITTRYEQTIRSTSDEAERLGRPAPSFEDFQKVLPISGVNSAGLFDPEAYDQFQIASRNAASRNAGEDEVGG
jgi:hypothetical protein